MTAVSTALAVLLAAIVVAVVVALFTTPRQPVEAVAEPKPASEPDPVDEHFRTAAAHLQPDAPIEPTWAGPLLTAIANLTTPADMEVTR